MSLVTRKADAENRPLQAVREALAGGISGSLRMRTLAGL
jgi:hypothetical protein